MIENARVFHHQIHEVLLFFMLSLVSYSTQQGAGKEEKSLFIFN